jgi:hypothetical protein
MLIPISRHLSRMGWRRYAYAHGLEGGDRSPWAPKQGEKTEGGAISGQLGCEKPFVYSRSP